jgi:hypothetical protein
LGAEGRRFESFHPDGSEETNQFTDWSLSYLYLFPISSVLLLSASFRVSSVLHHSAFLFLPKKETLAKKKLSGCISPRAAYGGRAVTTHKLAALKQGLPRTPCRLQQLFR